MYCVAPKTNVTLLTVHGVSFEMETLNVFELHAKAPKMFLKYSAVPYSAITCDIDDEMANFLFPSFLWIHLVSRENFIPSSFQQIETHSNNNKRSEERKWCWVMWSVMKYLRTNIGPQTNGNTYSSARTKRQ